VIAKLLLNPDYYFPVTGGVQQRALSPSFVDPRDGYRFDRRERLRLFNHTFEILGEVGDYSREPSLSTTICC
jgi:hypothetical protein